MDIAPFIAARHFIPSVVHFGHGIIYARHRVNALMVDYAVGLAAPQIGLPISLIVIDGSPLAEDFPECKNSKMVLINPMCDAIEDEFRPDDWDGNNE